MQRRQVSSVFTWIEMHGRAFTRFGASDCNLVRRRLVSLKSIEQARDTRNDSCSHQHERHAGQHGSVDRWQQRHLNLLEVVDSDRAVMPFAREEDLHEIADDGELRQR